MSNRRDFVKLALSAVGGVVGSESGWTWSEGRQPQIRYEVNTMEGQQMLSKMTAAIAIMMRKPETDILGWNSWWYTHAVRDDRGKTAEINRIFGNVPSGSKTLAERVWDTCAPHHGEDEDLFLPWHRLFVASFENTVRLINSDPTFTIPYWNYIDAGGRSLPQKFIAPADIQTNGLFRQERNPGANRGTPIDDGLTQSPINLNDLKFDDYSRLCENLDLNLHGNIHVLIGNQHGMGSVPWAGSDPVFWLHHCNIDRLWASWNQGGGKNPGNDAFLQKTLVFPGPSSQLAQYKVMDCLETAHLGYTYSTLEGRPARQRDSSVASFTASSIPSRMATNIRLGMSPTKAVLLSNGQQESIGKFTDAAPKTGSVALLIEGMRTNLQPNCLYEIFLNLPDEPTDDTKKTHYVGALNFFGASNHATRLSKFYIDITGMSHLLRAERIEPYVTVWPAGKPFGDAKPIITKISLLVSN
jgi:tyrosinase